MVRLFLVPVIVAAIGWMAAGPVPGLLAGIFAALLYPYWLTWRAGRKEARNLHLTRKLMAKYDFEWCVNSLMTENQFLQFHATQQGFGTHYLEREGRKIIKRNVPLRSITAELAVWYEWLDSCYPNRPTAPEPKLSKAAKDWIARNGRKEPGLNDKGYRRWNPTEREYRPSYHAGVKPKTTYADSFIVAAAPCVALFAFLVMLAIWYH